MFQRSRLLFVAAVAAALSYAAFSGLRTITDADVGWQLATGRYILQHGDIPAIDVLSFTARGEPWIYPVASQVFLYLVYLIGAFTALSWLNAATCAATVAIAMWADMRLGTAVLAVFAVPKIAYRTSPRADLFTTVLFTLLLAILWRHFRCRRAPLWAIPIVFVAWSNTHLGFIAGEALLAAYIGLEATEFLVQDCRAEARARLRKAAPWILAGIVATLCNWWGWRVYSAVVLQERAMDVQQNVIAEWRHVPLNAATLDQALDFRNPESGYLWLLGLAVIAALFALKRKVVGAALLLLFTAWLSVRHIRFQAVFCTTAMIIAPEFLAGLLPNRAHASVGLRERRRAQSSKRARGAFARSMRPAVVTAVGIVTILLVCVRAYDLFTQRSYIRAGEVNLFGSGLSSWYPERAAAFIARERLPLNIFHDYNLGGFVAFRLGPQYPDYIDGRAIPFGPLAADRRRLMREPPDSAAWQQEADKRGINTLLFSLARYWGLDARSLGQFCTSSSWTPVYLDEVSIVLVRNRPENAPWLDRLRVNCASFPFAPAPDLLRDHTSRGRAELFNFYAHAGSVLFKLSRFGEAAASLDQSLAMFPEEPFVHQIRGQVYAATGDTKAAEREYLTSVHLKPAETTWYTLATLYLSQGHRDWAASALQNAASLAIRPSQYYVSAAELYFSIGRTQQALEALHSAAVNTQYESPEMKEQIDTQIATVRARGNSLPPTSRP